MSRTLPRRLYRSRTDRMISGLSAGLAHYFDVDPTLVRLLWVLGAVFSGGLLVVGYIVLWIVVPTDPGGVHRAAAPPAGSESGTAGAASSATGEESAIGPITMGLPDEDLAELEPTERYRTEEPESARANRRLWAGVLLIGLGAIFLGNNLGLFWWFQWRIFWPMVLIGLGVLLLFYQARR